MEMPTSLEEMRKICGSRGEGEDEGCEEEYPTECPFGVECKAKDEAEELEESAEGT